MSVIRPATRGDIYWVSSRLSPEDYQEVETGTGERPIDILPDMMKQAQVYSIRCHRNSEPVALFGLMDCGEPGQANVFLLGTVDLPKVAKTLVGELPKWLNAWCEDYPILTNYADSRNELHLKYLRHIGFEIGEAVDVRGVPFHEIRYPCAHQP
jgi:hypothetical protein